MGEKTASTGLETVDERVTTNMLILPTSNVNRARRLMGQISDNRAKCALTVFGDDERAREIASRADVRAEGHPFRQVVWIPSPGVLDGVPTFAPLLTAANGHDVVALTIDFQVSSRLRGQAAMRFSELERAFADALAGKLAG